jgi:hypothetical protein
MKSNSTDTSQPMLPRSLALDGAGSVFLGGRFSGTGTFGSFTLTSAPAANGGGNNDAFAAQFDSANGTVVGAWNAHGNSLAIGADASGNIYLEDYYGVPLGNFPTGDPETSLGVFVAKFQPVAAAAANVAVSAGSALIDTSASVQGTPTADSPAATDPPRLIPAAVDQSLLPAIDTAPRHARHATPDAADEAALDELFALL